MSTAMLTALKSQTEPQAEQEHPVVALHGTGDLEAALSDEPASPAEQAAQASAQGDRTEQDVQVDDAVSASRWATPFAP
jgi:predicted esterase